MKWISGICAAALGAIAMAQPANSPRTVIKTSTRLVQVNVIVRDKKGPVTGLTKDDFVLQDQGKTQTIAFFEAESARFAGSTVSKTPANVFTNRVDRKMGGRGTITIVLLDEMNTSFEDQAHARSELAGFIEKMDERDRLAIYTLGTTLRVMADFSSDPAQLRSALRQHRGRLADELKTSEPAPSNTGNDYLDALIDESNAKVAAFAAPKRVRITLAALEAIAHHVEHVPGRKNLIWLSGGFPLLVGFGTGLAVSDSGDQRNFGGETARATSALSEADVTVYPVDARGLLAGSAEMDAAGKGRGNTQRAPATPMTTQNGLAAMQTIAEETGGRAFYNSNGLSSAISKALDDSAASYTLGFYPEIAEGDGQYHELKVSVRRKGVEVRHRKGYFASKDTGAASDRERQTAFATAAWSPVESTQIPLTAKTEFVNKVDSKHVQFSVIVDLRGVHLAKTGDHWTGELELHFLQKDKDERILDSTGGPVRLNFPDATYEQYRDGGFAIGQVLELKPGVQSIRVVILDHGAAEVGSLIIPVSEIK